MVNFETRKRILKKLSDSGKKNFLLFLPCLIASLFVKLYYFIVCHIDLALSDKEGNFLGIQTSEKAKAKKQDDIVYVKRPFLSRVLSAILTVAFAGTFLPAVSFAASATVTSVVPTEATEVLDPNTGYYYSSVLPDITNPVIDESGCKVGYNSFQYSWFDYDTSQVFDKFYLCYRVSGGAEVAKEVPRANINTANSTNTDVAAQSRIIPGNLSYNWNYEFYLKVTQKVQLYQKKVTHDDATGTDTVEYTPVSSYIYRDFLSDTVSAVPGVELNPLTFEANYDINAAKAIITVTSPSSVKEEMGKAPSGYYVMRSLDNVNYTIIDQSTTSLTFEDTNLKPTTKYYYKVFAYYNVYGLSSIYDKYNDKVPYYYTRSPDIQPETVITNTEPTALTATVNTKDPESIILNWSTVKNATGYYLYKYKYTEADLALNNFIPQLSDCVLLGEFPQSTKTYTDKDVANKSTYYYYIVVYNSQNELNPNSEPRGYKAIMNVNTSEPQNFIGEPGNGKVTLSWKGTDSAADGFEIQYMKITDAQGNPIVDANGDPVYNWENLDLNVSKSTTQYLHDGLYNGETYRYRIRTYRIIGMSDAHEPISAYVETQYDIKVGVGIDTPKNVTVTPADGSVTVKWNAVQGADGYYLHIQKLNSDGTTTDLPVEKLDAKTTSFNHINLHTGDDYLYSIEAFAITTAREYVVSDPSTPLKATVGIELTMPMEIKAVPGDGQITVSWKAVTGAKAYILHAAGGFPYQTKTFNTGSTSYVHGGLPNGETWTYYVQAVKYDFNNDPIYSPNSDTVTATVGTSFTAPPDLTATPSDGQIDVSWSSVKGAHGYILYATNGFESKQFDLSKTKFTHSGLTNGDTWTYRVCAYKVVPTSTDSNAKTYSELSQPVSATVGTYLQAPMDFTVTTDDASATLKWSAVKGAEGYVVYAYTNGKSYEFDASKPSYVHTGLQNGDTWYYFVKAFKTVNGKRVYSNSTATLSVRIGAALPAPPDLVATSGNRQIDLSWSAVKGAEGYVVYLYEESNNSFMPLSIVSKPKYSHTGLKNGQKYTYMVAAYKMINGERVYGDYSLAVTAMPSAGSAADVDTIINVKGTTPYGISHSELISAAANHEAFDEPVDAYFSVNQTSTNAIKEVLKHYANGLKSFIIFPFDISLYKENTLVSIEPNEGFSITFTVPVPDKLVPYRDYITVVHLQKDGTEVIYDDPFTTPETFIDPADLEILPSALIQINDIWCIQFTTTSCSPFAFVIYKDNIDDVSSGAASGGGTSAGDFNTGVLLFTALPDIMPTEKKTRFVVSAKKYYRIKKK